MAAIDLTTVTFSSILRELGLRILAPVLLIVAPAFSLVVIFGYGFPFHWALVALTIGAVPIGASLTHIYLKNRYPHISAFARLRPLPWRTKALLLVPIAMHLAGVSFYVVSNGGPSLHPENHTGLLISTFLVMVTLPVAEEWIFRLCALQGMVSLGVRAPLAVGLSALLFGGAHVSAGPTGIALIATIGACWAVITLRTRSIWPAIALHAAWNACEFLYGTLTGHRIDWDDRHVNANDALLPIAVAAATVVVTVLIAQQRRPTEPTLQDTVPSPPVD
ncbi:CPBP family intramembrane glutamic endopeptidase [Methylibium rhizosphaerae]|uniref:CPBP family intramembrane glutamic endopeptidase n=1 Tax=Methylibium rhizosphaerae TaxID=2570323 RepID=UPI0015E3ABE5|nr:type II CAAX endopeptidase family protein [Methylibium rhizosphaerae]